MMAIISCDGKRIHGIRQRHGIKNDTTHLTLPARDSNAAKLYDINDAFNIVHKRQGRRKSAVLILRNQEICIL